MGLLMLLMMIVDDLLGFEGAVIVVRVLLDCLVHMIFVCHLGNCCWSIHLWREKMWLLRGKYEREWRGIILWLGIGWVERRVGKM